MKVFKTETQFNVTIVKLCFVSVRNVKDYKFIY